MSSSITEIPSTSQVQIPSTQNNKLIKIGGAVAVFIIIVIILYFSFSSSSSEPSSTTTPTSTSTPTSTPTSTTTPTSTSTSTSTTTSDRVGIGVVGLPADAYTVNPDPMKNSTELHSKCNFNSMSAYIFDINKKEEINDIFIKSIKAKNVSITLYSNPNFTGEEMKLDDIIINKECLEKTFRSAIIEPKIVIATLRF